MHWPGPEQKQGDILYSSCQEYQVELTDTDGKLRMNFRKNHYRIGRHIDRFSKNILITDITDWTTDDIVQASLDHWAVEDGFRLTKDEELVDLRPIRHWTDSKIRLDLHPVFLVPDDENFVDSLHQNRKRDALFPGFQNETKIYYGASEYNHPLFMNKLSFMH